MGDSLSYLDNLLAKLNDNMMLQYPEKKNSYVPELQITTSITSERRNI